MNKTLKDERGGVALYKYVVSALLALVMGGFIVAFSDSLSVNDDLGLIAIVFSLIYFLGLMFISRLKDIELFPFLMISAGLAAVIVARVSMLPFVSMDYHNFIRVWLEHMSGMSVGDAITTEIGDYNLPYLYFLAILSRFEEGWMIAVKAFSCVFDVILAYYVMKIAEFKIKNTKILGLIFVLTMAVPTVLLNSACWGQCDAVYGALCVGSIYYAFKEDGIKSMIMFGLAFALKLQAIFIIPILIICFILGKINWYKLVIVPIVYVVCMVPAILCGRGMYDSLFVYVRQASQTQYQQLTLNAPSIWVFMQDASYVIFKWVGIMLAALIALAFVYLCYVYGDRIETAELVTVAYLTTLALPFFLPSMHDRYFFIADVFSVLVFFYDRKKWYVPFVQIFASFATYAIFLVNIAGLYNIRWCTLALMAVFVFVTKDFVEKLRVKEPVRTFPKVKNVVAQSEPEEVME